MKPKKPFQDTKKNARNWHRVKEALFMGLRATSEEIEKLEPGADLDYSRRLGFKFTDQANEIRTTLEDYITFHKIGDAMGWNKENKRRKIITGRGI